MNACSTDIKDMLVEDADLGLVFKNNLFISREPTSPANCVTIYDAPGGGVDLTANGQAERYYRHDIQVRIRNVSYTEAWALSHSIMDRLHARSGETWNNTFYALITCVNPPFVLTWDDNNRVIMVVNFRIQRR